MAKLIKISKTDSKSFAPIATECIVCGESNLHFDGNIKYNLCNKCLTCVDCNQSLVLEVMQNLPDSFTISTRSMIIESSIINSKSKIVFLEHTNFNEIYNKYKLKMN